MSTTAIMFPGQGAQHVGMGRDLFDRHPGLERLADAVLGYSIRTLCLEEGRGRIGQTQYTQPALFVVAALGYLELRDTLAEDPACLLGHSAGEFAALWAAGCLDFETALAIVRKRGELMADATRGGMCAVLGDDVGELAFLLAEVAPELDVANFNSDWQVVVSGPLEAFAALHPLADRRDWQVVRLNVSGAFHSRLMEPAARQFEDWLGQVAFAPPAVPVISNVTALPFPAGSEAIRQSLTQALTRPVRWTDSIRRARRGGCTTFLETGPGTVLSRLVERISGADPTPFQP
jgi:trans-AT polyketide synthase/acyltransferase/oxidoreductase domain-containing protein